MQRLWLEPLLMKSPCINICEIENGECAGCGRTLEEIANWTSYSEEERARVLERISNEDSESKEK